MIQVCYYRGCGVIYGEKEPLSDKRITHGLCPLHFKISMQELRDEIERLKKKKGIPKILLVDDSTLFRQLLKGALQDRFPSVEIHEAANGDEALVKTEASLPDLIFMDIRLPGENGLETTRKIKSRHPDIIVIILTGYDFPEYREASQRVADYFFSKDSSTAESVFAVVQSIL